MAYVLDKDRDLHDVGDLASRCLDRKPDVVPDPLSLLPSITYANHAIRFVKGDLTGHSDVSNDVALGAGLMDWPAILQAARNAGVRWYFIEDESPTSVQQIPQSLRFLEQVKF